MKIFSNFDTRLEYKIWQEYGEIFGKDKVMILHKTRRYLYYHVWLPIAICLGVGMIFSYLIYDLGANILSDFPFLKWVMRGFLCIYLLYTLHHALAYYMNYKMDFMVVTPKEIMKYDQEGVLQRSVEKLNTKHIKSVTISKDGFFASFFDIGDIYFLAEGEDARGTLVIQFVDAVESKERSIRHILGMDSMT